MTTSPESIRVGLTEGGYFLDQTMLINEILLLEPSTVKTMTPIASSDLLSNPSVNMDREYLSQISILI